MNRGRTAAVDWSSGYLQESMTSPGKLCRVNRGSGTKKRMRASFAVDSVGETPGEFCELTFGRSGLVD